MASTHEACADESFNVVVGLTAALFGAAAAREFLFMNLAQVGYHLAAGRAGRERSTCARTDFHPRRILLPICRQTSEAQIWPNGMNRKIQSVV